MVLGHLTVTAAVQREVRRRRPDLQIAPLALLVGAYLPDLIDKPVGILTGLSSRGYAHSIVVQAAAFLLLAILLRGRRRFVGTLALGAAFHLLEDCVEANVLWAPLRGPIPLAPPHHGLLESIVRYYTSGSALMWIEIVATVYWVAVGTRVWFGRSRARPPAELSSAADPA